jgi:hypothetical protein
MCYALKPLKLECRVPKTQEIINQAVKKWNIFFSKIKEMRLKNLHFGLFLYILEQIHLERSTNLISITHI